jgi:NAD(P)H dehydrogenase (quinone)
VRALVIYCHPDPDSLAAAARDRVLVGLERAGAAVRLTDLYAEGFDPLFDEHDRRTHLQTGVVESLRQHADDLQWCDTLVLVYPTWWSGQPAMLKGWIDRVWACGVAWDLPRGTDRLRPGLTNVRRIVAVTPHGSPKWVNALEGESGKRTVTRALRVLCHPLCRTTWVALYGVDRSTAEQRTAWLDRVERRLARL